MLKTIIKRNGSREVFQPSKLNKWSQWASEGLRDRVDWSGIVLETVKAFGEETHSQKLQAQLILNCTMRREWPYNLMAGKLFAATYRKEIYDEYIPTIKALHNKLHKAGLMVKLNYTDDEYMQIESMIDHNRDFNMAHFQIKQIRNKYAIKNTVTKKEYETPQFVYMRMAMQLAESETTQQRLIDVQEYYNHFSFNRINPPSPNYINLGTPHKGFASCNLYTTDDTAKSLAIGDHIAYVMTCMSAGIGSNLNIRSIGDPVRGGSITHNGKLPYYNALAGAVNANMQAGRGGACTTYYSAFDPEAEVLTMAQNPRTPTDKQNRDLHFAMMSNRFMGKKVLNNEDFFTFNTYTAPDLVKSFYSGDQDEFERIYNKHETDANFKKNYVNAREYISKALVQGFEVGTNYLAFIDEINRHTPYKEKIYSSNLCVAPETLLLTDNGYFPIKELEGKHVNVWNGKQWSATQVAKTGENQELVSVKFSNGTIIDCTPYHKFYVKDKNGSEVEKRAIDLVFSDELIDYITPDEQWHKYIEVSQVIFTGRTDDTYCVNEPLEHKVIFNGILTGNCLEITQPTSPYYDMRDLYSATDHGRGEVSLCSLAGIVECNIQNDEEYASATYYALKMIDYCIHASDYPLPHVGFTAKQRLNAGIGILGVATTMARANVRYNTKEGLQKLHDISERHAYFCISASLRLGKERGNAPWMHKTKWSEGWLPIDTYKSTVDELVAPNYKYDWDALRAGIVANKGIRNSSVIAHMPTESSSKASGIPNCFYPIRDLSIKKSDGSNVVDWCAVDGDILGDKYQSAWTIDSLDMIKCYAVVQKFTDQAISADLWKDRSKDINLSKATLIKEYLTMIKYGMKTRYYQNSLTGSQSGTAAPTTEVQTPVTPVIKERGCSGGVCDI